MSLYVVVTPQCEEDAGKHGQNSLVANVRTQVEATQNLTGFSFFFPTPLLKKSLGRSFRLVAYRRPVADDELILFLRVLARGSAEYEYFLANWDKDSDAVIRRFQPYLPVAEDPSGKRRFARRTPVGMGPARGAWISHAVNSSLAARRM